jgi:hypothetical protein
MQTRRRLFAVVLATIALCTVFTVPLAGCSSNKQSSAPLPDAATLLKESS